MNAAAKIDRLGSFAMQTKQLARSGLLDARYTQIAFLLLLLSYGLWARDFGIDATQIAFCYAVGLCTQAFFLRFFKLQRVGYLSAIVSCTGICILLRSDIWWLHGLLAAVALSSKFLLRAGPLGNQSHIFNPANLVAAIAACASYGLLSHVWLSPAQWGSSATLGLWIVALGGLVTGRIGRRDISLACLVCWGLLLAGRVMYLGYDGELALRMWLHAMGSGSLLVFAFFMISDPMTTPQTRSMRIAYAALVTSAAFVWQYGYYQPHGLVLSLCVMSLLVPLLNSWKPAPRFDWKSRRGRYALHGVD